MNVLQLRRKHVAVVAVRGAIGLAVRAEQYVPLLEALRKSRYAASAVLEIESPGGTVTGADYIYGELQRLAEVKPLYAFSGELCASGGYLLACAARELVVQPAAVIGSIGVISVRPLAEDLMRRVGVDVGVTKSGELKDLGAFWRRPTQREQAKEKELVDEYFELFIERIRAGRPKLEEPKLRKLATGEVFTGRNAVDLGLADRVGTLNDTIESAAAAGGVKPDRRRSYGIRRTLRQRLLGGMANEVAGQAMAILSDPRPRS